MFWAMLMVVGSTDPRLPNMPRMVAMAGAPVTEPNTADAPSTTPPSAQPTAVATRANVRSPVAATINAPLTGPKRLMPKLPHIVVWSNHPKVRGRSVVSSNGASTPCRSVV